MRSTLLALFFVASSCFAFSQSGQSQAGEPALSKLAERLVGPDNAVFIGELPSQALLPFDLPLPGGAQVIGSSVSNPIDRDGAPVPYRYATVYLEVPGAQGEAAAFYRRAFAPPAWNALDSYAVSGFLPSGTDHPNETLNFCRARTSVYLNFTAEGEVTRVDANINIAPEGEDVSWCQQAPSEEQQPLLPTLVAPEGSTSGTPDLMYGGATPGLGSSVIALETDLSVTELLAHYAAQLADAGWREIRTVGEGPLSVASYRFQAQGSSHLGTLQVVQNGTPGRYIAQMSALPR